MCVRKKISVSVGIGVYSQQERVANRLDSGGPSRVVEWRVSPVDEGASGYETRAEVVKDAIRHLLDESQGGGDPTQRLKDVVIRPDHTFLRDNILNRVVYVYRKDDTLTCDLCESDGCIHTRYVQTLPES